MCFIRKWKQCRKNCKLNNQNVVNYNNSKIKFQDYEIHGKIKVEIAQTKNFINGFIIKLSN